jgi:hypothetical protein
METLWLSRVAGMVDIVADGTDGGDASADG